MLTNLIWWIIVGLIAGWAAGKIMKGGGYGVAWISSSVYRRGRGWMAPEGARHLPRRIDWHHRSGDHRRHLPDLAQPLAQEGLSAAPPGFPHARRKALAESPSHLKTRGLHPRLQRPPLRCLNPCRGRAQRARTTSRCVLSRTSGPQLNGGAMRFLKTAALFFLLATLSSGQSSESALLPIPQRACP